MVNDFEMVKFTTNIIGFRDALEKQLYENLLLKRFLKNLYSLEGNTDDGGLFLVKLQA